MHLVFLVTSRECFALPVAFGLLGPLPPSRLPSHNTHLLIIIPTAGYGEKKELIIDLLLAALRFAPSNKSGEEGWVWVGW